MLNYSLGRSSLFPIRHLEGDVQTQIAISGAGPAGLALAIVLQQKGAGVKIFDRKSGPTVESRAMGVHARTLELYEAFGLSDIAVSKGIPAKEVEFFLEGEKQVEFSMENLGTGISKYPYMLTLPQDVHEQILLKKFEDLGGKVHWDHELTELSQSSAGVAAKFTNNKDETLAVECDWMVGCDGASSKTREILDIGFGGGTSSGLFFVADAEVETQHKNRIRASLGGSTFGLMMPIRSSKYQRLIGALPPSMKEKETFVFEDVRPMLEKLLSVEVKSHNWFSTYRVHHRVADTFSKGRVFIAGDAGHIHSPVGGQGMNTSIGDSINLGWKLAGVTSGQLNPKVLETYDPERRSFAKLLIKTTDAAFQRITAPRSIWSGVFAFGLPKILRVLTSSARIGSRIFRTVSQVHIGYPQSNLSKSGLGSIKAGQRLPWDPSGALDAALFSGNWTIVHFDGLPESLLEELGQMGVITHRPEYTQKLKTLGFKSNGVYLVRPDGHVSMGCKIEELGKELASVRAEFWVND